MGVHGRGVSTREVQGVGVWKHIRKCCGHTRIVMGDRSKIKFWHNLWCRVQVLKDTFPKFSRLCEWEALVVDLMEISCGSIRWNVNFMRVAHVWEVDNFAYFSKPCMPWDWVLRELINCGGPLLGKVHSLFASFIRPSSICCIIAFHGDRGVNLPRLGRVSPFLSWGWVKP